jgi:hypothetical protein
MLRLVAPVGTDVSEELSAFIIRVPSSSILVTLIMEDCRGPMLCCVQHLNPQLSHCKLLNEDSPSSMQPDTPASYLMTYLSLSLCTRMRA